jgi:dTDP-L-rhamnose 4-epimerase
VLVTGGAGFIGSAVVDRLVARGHEVVVIDHLHPAAHSERPDYVSDDADYRWQDLRDIDAVRDAVRGVDAVCHQASMVGLGVDFADVGEYVAHNDLGTAQLLRALHERGFDGRIVLASSMVVYGEGAYRCAVHGATRPGPRHPDHIAQGRFEPPCPRCGSELQSLTKDEHAAVDPRNVYAATKLHQEHLCSAFGHEHGTSVIALRYHNVYGPRMPRDTPYAGVASIFRSAAEGGRAPQVFEDGLQRRDFVHVDDVAQVNLLALEAPPDVTGPFNVASGEPHTVLDMAESLVDAIGREGTAPRPVVVGGFRPGDVRHITASPRRAEAVLGFRTQVSFVDGITQFAHDPLRS